MNTITTGDGSEIYYKDWGTGQPVVFSHGWPLSSDSWESPMLFLASCGYRCIAPDRRGHGRSSQPWNGNDMSALKIYPGAPHGRTETHKDKLNANLLSFLTARNGVSPEP